MCVLSDSICLVVEDTRMDEVSCGEGRLQVPGRDLPSRALDRVDGGAVLVMGNPAGMYGGCTGLGCNEAKGLRSSLERRPGDGWIQTHGWSTGVLWPGGRKLVVRCQTLEQCCSERGPRLDHQHPHCLRRGLTSDSRAASQERGCNLVAHGPLYR